MIINLSRNFIKIKMWHLRKQMKIKTILNCKLLMNIKLLRTKNMIWFKINQIINKQQKKRAAKKKLKFWIWQ